MPWSHVTLAIVRVVIVSSLLVLQSPTKSVTTYTALMTLCASNDFSW